MTNIYLNENDTLFHQLLDVLNMKNRMRPGGKQNNHQPISNDHLSTCGGHTGNYII